MLKLTVKLLKEQQKCLGWKNKNGEGLDTHAKHLILPIQHSNSIWDLRSYLDWFSNRFAITISKTKCRNSYPYTFKLINTGNYLLAHFF